MDKLSKDMTNLQHYVDSLSQRIEKLSVTLQSVESQIEKINSIDQINTNQEQKLEEAPYFNTSYSPKKPALILMRSNSKLNAFGDEYNNYNSYPAPFDHESSEEEESEYPSSICPGSPSKHESRCPDMITPPSHSIHCPPSPTRSRIENGFSTPIRRDKVRRFSELDAVSRSIHSTPTGTEPGESPMRQCQVRKKLAFDLINEESDEMIEQLHHSSPELQQARCSFDGELSSNDILNENKKLELCGNDKTEC